MKPTYKKILFVVFVISLLAVAYKIAELYSRYGRETAQAKLIENILGKSEKPEYQDFENTIRNFFFIGIDDIHRGFGPAKIDIGERKKTFSDKGWTEYLKFVNQQKKILKNRQADSIGMNQVGDLIGGTQQHRIIDNNRVHFTADGMIAYGPFDSYNQDTNFTVDVIYSDNGDGQFKIDHWSVQIPETVAVTPIKCGSTSSYMVSKCSSLWTCSSQIWQVGRTHAELAIDGFVASSWDCQTSKAGPRIVFQFANGGNCSKCERREIWKPDATLDASWEHFESKYKNIFLGTDLQNDTFDNHIIRDNRKYPDARH